MIHKSHILSVVVSSAFVLLGNGHVHAQGDAELLKQADKLFEEKKFPEAMPMFSQLVSLSPSDHVLSYKLGTCIIHSDEDKGKAISFLEYAIKDPSTPALAHFYYGRALHLDYQFRQAATAYSDFTQKAGKRELAEYPVQHLIDQCRNGGDLLSNIKDVRVLNKVQVTENDFFRYYDLDDIGGRIVVTPEELMTNLDKKKGERSLVYLPEKEDGAIYFASYGKDGRTGRDIYRTQLMPNGTFAEPHKLAGYINTDQDEDFAYMQPDGKTFYFSSKGHNSMGGYDVFKSVYDPGNDVFGPPVNMDFAVNTPHDDVFYITDPAGEQACFASGRGSEQGQIHVYRVQTDARPIALTILAGQFNSELDVADKDATITVQDGVSKETIGEFTTNNRGEYVISLPHAGKYRFLVQAGPTGRTHMGIVDLPRNTAATAYRQELTLVEQNDQEKLLITNYFDEPLSDDLMALAMDEIKRLARLEVNGEAEEVVQVQEEEELSTADVIRQAGFVGGETEQDILVLAQEETKQLESTSNDRRQEAVEAYRVADQRAGVADQLQREAEVELQQAQATSGGEANEHMKQAAILRQRSRQANTAARASHQLAQQLEQDAAQLEQQALEEAVATNKLKDAFNTKNTTQASEQLKALKERVDIRNRPGNSLLDVTERLRREAIKQQAEADGAMKEASASRRDEQELEMRIKRLREEAAATKKTKVREQLEEEAAGYEEQLGHLKDETEAAFTEANKLARNVEIAETQTAIAEKVVENDLTVPGNKVLTPQEKDALGGRIAGNDKRIEELAIDERLEAELMETNPVLFQKQEFEWQLADAALREQQLASADPTPTSIGPIETFEGPSRRTSTTTATTSGRSDQRDTQTMTSDGTTIQERPIGPGNGTSSGEEIVTSEGRLGITDPAMNDLADLDGEITMEQPVDTPENIVAQEAAREAEEFLMENRIAELEQLRDATRDDDEKAGLNGQITELRQRLERSRSSGNMADGTEANEPEGAGNTALEFDPEMGNGSLIALLDPGYIEASGTAEGADQDRLNEQVITQIDEQIQQQREAIDSGKMRLVQAQPRIARLRTLRKDMEDLPSGTTLTLTLDPKPSMVATTTTATSELETSYNEPTPKRTTSEDGPVPSVLAETVPEERYVSINRRTNMQEVLELPVDHRVSGYDDVKKDREQDLAKAEELKTDINEMLNTLDTMELGKKHDKLMKEAAKKQDDLLFHRVEMGQRSGFLVQKERAHMTDSLKVVEKDANKLGFGTGEPALYMAKSYKNDARLQFEKADKLRKQGDRSQNVEERDSLYRHAYAQELIALKSMDRSITAYNYLLDKDTEKSVQLTYAQIEQALFGGSDELIAQNDGSVEGSETIDPTETEQGTQEVEGPSDTTVDAPNALDILAQNNDQEDEVAQQQQQDASIDDPMTQTQEDPIENDQATQTRQPNTTAEGTATEITFEVENEGEGVATSVENATDGPSSGINTDVASIVPVAVNDMSSPEVEQLRDQAMAAREEAKELERQSIHLADRSIELGDSAETVKRKDKEEVMAMSTDALSRSNDLRERSLAKLQEADELEVEATRMEERLKAKASFDRYYALAPADEAIVSGSQKHMDFFKAKSTALAENDQAAATREEAERLRGRSAKLIAQAQEIMVGDVNSDSPPSTVDVQQAKALNDEAVQLTKQADALDKKADRLESAAGLKETRAEIILNELDAATAEELLAIEARSRRDGELLATTSLAEKTEEAPRENDQVTEEDTTSPPASSDVMEPVSSQSTPSTEAPFEPTTSATPPGTTPGSTSITSAPEGTSTPPEIPIATTSSSGRSLLPPLEADVFNITSNKKSTAIEIDAPMPAGLVYKVQVGAFRNVIPDSVFAEFSPIVGESTNSGFTRYTVGLFGRFNAANIAKEEVRALGYSDAFVVAYLNGERIPLYEARAYSGEQEVASTLPVRNSVGDDRSSSEPQSTSSSVADDTSSDDGTADNVAHDDPRDRFNRIDPDDNGVPTVPDPVDGTDLPVDVTAEPATITTKPPVRTDPVVRYAKVNTAEEALAEFDPSTADASYYDENAAPAKQVEVIKGLFFTVQVGVYSKPVQLDQIFNITPLNTELIQGGKIRYTTGMHMDLDAARKSREVAVNKGVTDAFITAYMNGERITVSAARDLLDRFGPSILVTGN